MPKRSRSVPIRVVKEYLDDTIRTEFRKDFQRMPRLYLELFENPSKIKSSILGTEFVPKYDSYKSQNLDERPSDEKRPIYNDDDSDADSSDMGSDISIDDKPENTEEEVDELTDHLKKLLDDGDGHSTDSDSSVGSVRRSVRSKRRTPPTLDQLRQTGQYGTNSSPIREVKYDMSEEEEEDKKRELLFKFDMLKKSYKGAHIPEYSVHTDYKTMERDYRSTVKKLSLDSTVENYKTYLIGGFMLVEFVFGSWFKFDMQGFTQQQILSMQSYEKLLIELGEKSYVPDGSQWPVELRLLFLIIINAAFFIVSKLILRKTGSNLMNMVNSMNSTIPPTTPVGPKRKMKGPSINLDEIPEFKEN